MKKIIFGMALLSSFSVFAQQDSKNLCILTTIKYDSQIITNSINRYRALFTVHKNKMLIGKFGINQYSDGVVEDNSESDIDDFYNHCDVPNDFEEKLLKKEYKSGHVLRTPRPLCIINGLRKARQPITQSLYRNQYFFNISKSGKSLGRYGINKYTDGVIEDNSASDINNFYEACKVTEQDFLRKLFNDSFSNGDGV